MRQGAAEGSLGRPSEADINGSLRQSACRGRQSDRARISFIIQTRLKAGRTSDRDRTQKGRTARGVGLANGGLSLSGAEGEQTVRGQQQDRRDGNRLPL